MDMTLSQKEKNQPDNPTLTALVFLAGTLLVVFFWATGSWQFESENGDEAPKIPRNEYVVCVRGPGPPFVTLNGSWGGLAAQWLSNLFYLSARSGICLVHVWSSSYILTVISQKFNAHNCPHPRNKNERTTKNTRFHIVWKHTNISFNFHMAIWLSYCQCLP